MTCLIYAELGRGADEWRVSGTKRGEQLRVLAVSEREGRRGTGEGFLGFGEGQKRGVDVALPAQFRRGCPSDIPLGFGTGHGERGDKTGEKGMEEEEEEERPCLTPSVLERTPPPTPPPRQTTPSPPLQSGYLLDPRRLLLCILIPHYNNLEREQRAEPG